MNPCRRILGPPCPRSPSRNENFSILSAPAERPSLHPKIASPARMFRPTIASRARTCRPKIASPARTFRPRIASPVRTFRPTIASPVRTCRPTIALPARTCRPTIALRARMCRPWRPPSPLPQTVSAREGRFGSDSETRTSFPRAVSMSRVFPRRNPIGPRRRSARSAAIPLPDCLTTTTRMSWSN